MCTGGPDIPEPKDNPDYNAQNEELVISDEDDNRSKTAASKRRGTQSLTIGLNSGNGSGSNSKNRSGAGLAI